MAAISCYRCCPPVGPTAVSFHGSRRSSLTCKCSSTIVEGSYRSWPLPKENAEAWWAFVSEHPGAWAALVRRLHLTSMSLDEPCVVRHLAEHPDAHRCRVCACNFPSERSLQSHIRTKHRNVSDVSRFVGISRRCCVCCTQFSTRTRLVAHLTDNRRRGRRAFTCRDVLRSGFVKEVNEQEFKSAHLHDRELRRQARKRGHTQPHALYPAKRLKVGACCGSVAMSCTEDIPSNRLDWLAVPPAKRLRRKTSLDEIITDWVHR